MHGVTQQADSPVHPFEAWRAVEEVSLLHLVEGGGVKQLMHLRAPAGKFVAQEGDLLLAARQRERVGRQVEESIPLDPPAADVD